MLYWVLDKEVLEAHIVTMEWKGAKSKDSPLAFVGKGVCFDTGGISLKPAKLWRI